MAKIPDGPCPEWHDEKFEDILTWADARVEYEDTFTSPKYGMRKVPELAHWVLFDGHGWLGFSCFKQKTDEKKARMAGAMFIYLWMGKKLPAGVADPLCVAYVQRVEKTQPWLFNSDVPRPQCD